MSDQQWRRSAGGAVSNTNTAAYHEFVSARAKKQEQIDSIDALHQTLKEQQEVIDKQSDAILKLNALAKTVEKQAASIKALEQRLSKVEKPSAEK